MGTKKPWFLYLHDHKPTPICVLWHLFPCIALRVAPPAVRIERRSYTGPDFTLPCAELFHKLACVNPSSNCFRRDHTYGTSSLESAALADHAPQTTSSDVLRDSRSVPETGASGYPPPAAPDLPQIVNVPAMNIIAQGYAFVIHLKCGMDQ